MLPKSPGVFQEEISHLPPSVPTIESCVPAFIGYTEKAQVDAAGDLTLQPMRVASLADFERYFGTGQAEGGIVISATVAVAQGIASLTAVNARLALSDRSKHVLYGAMQLYFGNGGRECWIVSLGAFKPLGAPLVVSEFLAGLAVAGKSDGVTLLVIPETQGLSITESRQVHDAALTQCANLRNRITILDVHGGAASMADPAASLRAGVQNFRNSAVGDANLRFGAAYAPNLVTSLAWCFDEDLTRVSITVDGVSEAAVSLRSLQGTMVGGLAEGALYVAAKSAVAGLPHTLPPSGAVAGVMCAVDRTRGVWKAPANVALALATGAVLAGDDAVRALMNVDGATGKSVNSICHFPGKGLLVWGARTLDGNSNDWRYISTVRFSLFVERTIGLAMEQFQFEANAASTWEKIKVMLGGFLTQLWRQGALQGSKPEQAFFVAMGLGRTMTANDVAQGKLKLLCGLAILRANEFTYLQLERKMGQK